MLKKLTVMLLGGVLLIAILGCGSSGRWWSEDSLDGTLEWNGEARQAKHFMGNVDWYTNEGVKAKTTFEISAFIYRSGSINESSFEDVEVHFNAKFGSEDELRSGEPLAIYLTEFLTTGENVSHFVNSSFPEGEYNRVCFKPDSTCRRVSSVDKQEDISRIMTEGEKSWFNSQVNSLILRIRSTYEAR